MKTIHVSLKNNSYKIIVGNKILLQLGSKLKQLKIGQDAIVITNPTIQRLHGRALSAGLKRKGFTAKVFTVPDGERAKSAKYAFDLMTKIARYDVMKRPFIVAFGGGVVGDLAGYVAAAYKRGIPYVQVPTTFLAQIDSAIGGKTAIDLPVGKNLVGAFYQPKLVYSDVATLSTLGKRQMRNGLSEAVKYGIIADKSLFGSLAKNYSEILNGDPKTLTDVVVRCSRIKARVVALDEKETKGIRTILNFGHTIGHAIEAAGKYKRYHHGEAIALGMRAAAELSCKRGLLSLSNAARINQVLSDIGLPQRIIKVRVADILRTMAHDKKFRDGKNRFVLAQTIGRVKVCEGIPLSLITRTIKKLYCS